MAYHRLTLTDLLDTLKASWESTPFWTDAEGTAYLNHGLRFWNLLTGYWKRKVLVGASGNAYQQLPGSITFGMQVIWGPIDKPLQVSALADLDFAQPRWEEETVADGGTIPTSPQLWAPVGLKEIAVWPTPPAATPLLVDGVAATPLLALPADFVDTDDWVASLVVGFALHVGCFKRGLQAAEATASNLREFVEGAADQNVRLKRSTFYRKFLGLEMDRALRPTLGGGVTQRSTPGGGR